MSVKEILKYLKEWADRFDVRLSELIESLEKRIQGLQRSLWDKILETLYEIVENDGKKLSKEPTSISRALQKLEALLNEFERSNIDPELKLFAAELLEVGGLSVEYYEATAKGSATAGAIKKSLDLLRASIGITAAGPLVKGGYLYRLGKTEFVREVLRSYVVNSIVSGRSLADFKNGFKDLVVGNSDTEGALQKYWRQYAYDSYNKAHEVVNLRMSEELQLRFFIYQGSIIKTSRAFCIKRAGKVFSREEALKWKDDPDLIEPSTKDTYNPFIERGRYNCRHFLNWISDELAAEIKKKP